MISQRNLEAVRVAARAVAAVMRGATIADLRLDEPVPSVPREPDSPAAEEASGEAALPAPPVPRPEASWTRQTPFDLWFVTWAGVWADSALRWRHAADLAPTGDAAADAAVMRLTEDEWCARMREVRGPDGTRFSEHDVAVMYEQFTVGWQRELSRRWAVIQSFAEVLERGDTLTDWMVRARVDVISRWRYEEQSSPQG